MCCWCTYFHYCKSVARADKVLPKIVRGLDVNNKMKGKMKMIRGHFHLSFHLVIYVEILPTEHVSFVQGFPSLQLRGVFWQPTFVMHVSLVHGLWSSHAF